ncbi:WWE domain-containing protein [Durusdinium trenchii]|uniref:WWE domain-containing protein n=1 Tax=Durusdinium trenchii TaxID=1381693 RepID=A0ABP0NBN0_9DINO
MSFTSYFLGKEPDAGPKKVLEAALAYHDLGLWSDLKASYLGPSAERARKDLSGTFSEPELKQIEDIIMNHHKYTEASDPLVDAMRKADWLDFTNNLRFPMRSGMPSGNLAKANTEVPREGFFTALAKRHGSDGDFQMESPSAADIKTILEAGGISYEEEMITTVCEKMDGKKVEEMIKTGFTKFAACGGGGGGGGGGGAASGGGGGGAAAGGDGGAKEEKKVVEEEEEEEMEFDLFG